jgi:lipopolysaccharide export system protein LptA
MAYAAISVLACLARAQDPPAATPKRSQDELRIQAGDGEMNVKDPETGRIVSFFTGQVRVTVGDLEITAGRMMTWSKDRAGVPDEIYAEGNVVFRRGDQKLRADRLLFDLVNDRAIIVDLKAEGSSADLKQRFALGAAEARMTRLGRIEADDVSLSTCTYGLPHYHVKVRRGVLEGRDPRPRESRLDLFPYRNWRFYAEDIYPEFGAPLFFLPGLVLGPWIRDFPVRSIQYGRSSRFGHAVESEIGLKLKRTAEGGKERLWGELIAEADWREKRGGGYGLDLDYRWGGYSGFVDTYFLHDQGRDLEVGFEQKFPPLSRKERGRARAFHRHDFDENWRFELEGSYVSDESLLEEFFEKEFKEGKEPETAAYVRTRVGSAGGYVLERHRLNDFQSQNEYLPWVDFSLLHVPVLEGPFFQAYFAERVDAVHLRNRPDEALGLPSERIGRADSVSEIGVPLDLGFLQLAPFGRNRTTAYEHDLQGQTEVRSIWSAGARATMVVHATEPALRWEAVGLRGLRHVMELEARYAGSTASNVDRSDLFGFDEVEELGAFEEWGFEVRHRFSTKDQDGPEGKRFDFLDIGVQAEYYPESWRDTLAAHPDNYLPPFGWIPLLPAPGGAGFARRHWSNLHWDLRFEPRNVFWVRGAGEYNPHSREEEVREAVVGMRPWTGLSVEASHAFVRGLTDAYGLLATWDVTEKWSAGVGVQYDFRADEYVSQSLVVSRDYHDFLVQAVLEHDVGRDERRVYVAFVPKFLGSGSGRGRLPQSVERR